ncbi:MAG: sugar phosphate isomerase/epimerase [Anaerolineae bacterium]|nr:sugar phosphate isomerase/epimerase [Anaerolineae bacterium]
MHIAVQEAALPGSSVLKKFKNARALGFHGVEVQAEDLTERVPEVVEAILATGVQVAAVHMGRRDGYLSPERAEREAAIGALRQAMADAVDLGANHVIFVPHFGSTRMPDLTPYRAPVELEAEMMIWLLRTVSDLAYALGVELDMLPVNQTETYFMTRIDHAVRFRIKVKSHPHIKIAANLFHMAQEEPDWLAVMQGNLPHIGYIQLADQNHSLPGPGTLDFATLARVLVDYEGWLTCACEEDNSGNLSASLDFLRQSGFVWSAPERDKHE